MFNPISHPLTRRAFIKMLGLSGLAVFFNACDALPFSTAPVSSDAPTPTDSSPTSEAVARAFLQAWSKGDSTTMYQLLTTKSQTSITLANFTQRYQSTLAEMTATTIHPQFVSVLEEANTATVQFKSQFETAVFGVIVEDNALALVREEKRWAIAWSPSNIFSSLNDNNVLKLYPAKSTRGNIYDRNGQPIALGQKSILVSLWPGEMKRQQSEAQVLAALSQLLNLSTNEIRRLYSGQNPEWKVPIATISQQVALDHTDVLALPGIVSEEQDARTYPPRAAAAHLAGYIGQITAEELAQSYVKGYREQDLVGRAGLEKAGEKYIVGTRGGRLALQTTQGDILTTLKEVAAQQSQSIYSTIDLDLQTFVDGLLDNQRGSIVVMDVKNGDILALASHPTYDPNVFVDTTRQRERQNILSNAQRPLLNRATQGQYPHGSVQKIITTAAALERGGIGQYSPFVCTGIWKGLGYPKACWINAIGRTHGTVNLLRSLTVSCDITFYQVGLLLDKKDPSLMPNFAYAFGLGNPTGVTLEESAGNVPDPKKQQDWKPTDPVDMAIGQDTFLVSPLQVVDFVAAVANGGTLWKPRLIAKIQDIVNGTEQTLPPEKRGTLPVSAGNLKIIRDALKGVTTDKDGTAKYAFDGLSVICAGKTGTAQVPGANEPHAWFAGYAPADNPEIACVVMIENGGEGSKASAPLFRKVVEKYFKVQSPSKGTPTGTPPPGD